MNAPKVAVPKVGVPKGSVPQGSPTTVSTKWILQLTGALVRRPGLIPTAITQALRLAPQQWWRSRPWLPLPASDYLHFRAVTAYGDPDHEPDIADVVTWLEWSKAWPAATRSNRPNRPEPNVAAK